jgi:hypothetical protein
MFIFSALPSSWSFLPMEPFRIWRVLSTRWVSVLCCFALPSWNFCYSTFGLAVCWENRGKREEDWKFCISFLTSYYLFSILFLRGMEGMGNKKFWIWWCSFFSFEFGNVLAEFDGFWVWISNQEDDLGTTSLGILYLSFTFFSLVASVVVRRLGTKNALVLGTTGYWLFIAANLKPTW